MVLEPRSFSRASFVWSCLLTSRSSWLCNFRCIHSLQVDSAAPKYLVAIYFTRSFCLLLRFQYRCDIVSNWCTSASFVRLNTILNSVRIYSTGFDLRQKYIESRLPIKRTTFSDKKAEIKAVLLSNRSLKTPKKKKRNRRSSFRVFRPVDR